MTPTRAIILLAALLLAGCGRRETSSAPATAAPATAAPAAAVLRLAQRNEPVSLDPATTPLPDEIGILRAFYEGLLLPGPDGSAPVPGAAESFAVSADGLVYTFRLRKDARWSDGSPVTAAHFVDSFRRTLLPATAAPKANVFYDLKNARAFNAGRLADFAAVGFRAPDAATLEITLEAPNPRFPYYVASGPWLPVRADLVARDAKALGDPARFVGNGPFLLKEWRPDQRIVAAKNPAWHGAAGVALAEIRWLRFDSGDSEDRAYRAGQIDATMSVPFSKVQPYAAERPGELKRSALLETRYLAFNTRKPLLSDPRVRRALALAIDRAQICTRVLQGGQLPAGVLIPAALRRPDAATPPTYAHGFAPDEARASLAASGVDVAKLNGLELAFWGNPAALEAIQEMWRRELGLRVQLVQREARVHLDALRSGHFDLGLITIIPDVADPLAFVEDFTGTGGENYPQLQDAEFDRHLAARRPFAAEQRLLELAALTPVYFNTKIFLLSPAVRGWNEDALWGRTYHGITLGGR
jgi:oligopeptide transport system substrate-binding protein